jgi:DNA replication protein DnaC
VGKSWFGQALGHSACRAGHRVRFSKVTKLVGALRQARADHSVERELRTWLAPDVLILDDFGLRRAPRVQRPLRRARRARWSRRHRDRQYAELEQAASER